MTEVKAFIAGAILASSIWCALFTWSYADHVRAYNDLTTRWQALVAQKRP